MANFGPAGLNSNSNSPQIDSKNDEVASVRVRDIVLGPDHPRFNEVGGWRGLGTVFFSSVDIPGLKNPSQTEGRARPYFSNSRFYPLINELVTVINATNFIASQNLSLTTTQELYYFPPVNGWNGVNHNALPDPIQKGVVVSSPKKNYSQVQSGMINRESSQTDKIYLGSSFKEKNNIIPLYFYEGDHILEGRWGNSIRFGSTVRSTEVLNKWSSEGEEGDPILILRNGTLPSLNNIPSYVPTVEDISNDLSSIYLTSTQKLPFFPSSFKTTSFGENDVSPTSPSEYQGNQIILTSGRLILNSQSDGVLISSPSVIHLSAGDSVHLDCSDKIVFSTETVYLGSRNTEERAVLGDKLILHLRLLLEVLEGTGHALTNASANGIAVESLNNVGPNLVEAVKDFKLAIEGDNPKILSKSVKLV